VTTVRSQSVSEAKITGPQHWGSYKACLMMALWDGSITVTFVASL